MIIIFSLLAAIVPMLLYLFFVWKFDRYDREPISLVLISYFWGAAGAIILTLILSTMLELLLSVSSLKQNIPTIFSTSVVAPVLEEMTKGFFLLIMVRNNKFDNVTDGIVYGAAIGLGFGMTENFLYFIANSSSLSKWIFVVVVRTFFSAVMHGVATGTFGAFVGHAKFKRGLTKGFYTLAGLLIAMAIHATWNTFVTFESTAWIGIVFMILSIAIFITVFNLSVRNEAKMIYSELNEEYKNGLIPFEHLSILSSSIRNSEGWIDDVIRKSYVTSAISLAFRKIQHKNSVGVIKNYYEAEVEKLRNSIAILLNKK